VVVGNALSRGNPAVEPCSTAACATPPGPSGWRKTCCSGRWVLAVAGTHGKTTTASMLAWILEQAGLEPGFLIGGVPANFGVSARLGGGSFFVVEADEYDTAFFDKRSKFVHYRPRTAGAEQPRVRPRRHLPRPGGHPAPVPPPGAHRARKGLLVVNAADGNLAETLAMGCWTPDETVSAGSYPAQWTARLLAEDGSDFEVLFEGRVQGRVQWGQLGAHNLHNALSAIAAARHAGVPAAEACAALGEFRRREAAHGSARRGQRHHPL
jgi:UDP-N-acetylmuramate: L-alanyl-gamma-D-glutamyl-meso-diaminopimelate ligase